MNRLLTPTRPAEPPVGLPMIGLVALLALTSWLIAGVAGTLVAVLAITAALVLLPPLHPARAMRWLRAVPIRTMDAPSLKMASHALAQRAGLAAAPHLYWLPQWMPNAVAVGNAQQGAIGLSLGAARLLGPREIRAVLAHEVAHLAAGDVAWTRLATVFAHAVRGIALAGLVLIGARVLAGTAAPSAAAVILLLIAAPVAAAMLQSAASREREFAADRRAAELTGDPLALASALTRIERHHRRRLPAVLRQPAVDFALLRSHPATNERVDRLLAVSRGGPAIGPADSATGASAGPWGVRLVAW